MDQNSMNLLSQILNNDETAQFVSQINEICAKNPINYDKIIELAKIAAKIDSIRSPGYSAELLQFALTHWIDT